jgi:hypothetical protein
MNNEDWVVSGNQVLSVGVLLDSSVNSDSSLAMASVPFAVTKI